jgi:hypothetical protein
MKKVKLMLLSLSVLSVVGGALAFTAKTGTQYCTTIVDQISDCAGLPCPNLARIRPTTNDVFICTAQSVNNTCEVDGVTVRCGGNPVKSTNE